MYKNSFLAAVKVNNRTLREKNNRTVYLPFNSEYSILLRNDHWQRACVAIKIDGTDVLGGDELILNGNSEINLERFLVDGNLNSGNKFKFVKASDSRVQDPTSPENGLVEIEFWLEKPPTFYYHYSNNWPWTKQYEWPKTYNYGNTTISNSGGGHYAGNISCCSAKITPDSAMVKDSFASDIGATVEGGKSSQSFFNTTFGEKQYPSTVIKLWLRGLDRPITTTDDLYCTNCGKKLKFDYEFCPKCGTSVVIE